MLVCGSDKMECDGELVNETMSIAILRPGSLSRMTVSTSTERPWKGECTVSVSKTHRDFEVKHLPKGSRFNPV